MWVGRGSGVLFGKGGAAGDVTDDYSRMTGSSGKLPRSVIEEEVGGRARRATGKKNRSLVRKTSWYKWDPL